jgi:hypothetical protein
MHVAGKRVGDPTSTSDSAREFAISLAYRKSLNPGCTCRGAGAVALSMPITRDPTLARGDIVVTQKGSTDNDHDKTLTASP